MFEIKPDSFYMDGKKFKLYSGALHYFRILPEYWEDRMLKMKACGFNAVETILVWNMHEPKEGEFNFTGMFDIVKFCEVAKKVGLYVIVRPGPYTCAEWDFGGFPAWLLKDKNLRIRCNNDIYMSKVENYFKKVLSLLAPVQINNGGNLIAMQIENEYGSYGNDKKYLLRIESLLRDNGIVVPLFTSDGTNFDMLSGGTLPHIYSTQNFGSRGDTAFDNIRTMQQGFPKTCMEFWCGWFDHWNEIHHRRNPLQVASEFKKVLDNDANINIYMFHGGTNFNFWAGANYAHKYMPTVTSYDDAAILNEYGDYTPAYHKIRRILLEKQGKPLDTPLPARPQLQNVGRVELTKRGDLWQNLYTLGEKHYSATPESMEYFGQNFGYILYKTVVKGKYGAHNLIVEGVHDIAYVRINGELVASYSRAKNGKKRLNDGFRCKAPAFEGELTIEILVEGMGRVNYGHEMERDRKGIQKVLLDYQTIFDWDIYTLPMDNLDKVNYDNSVTTGKPAILKGYFEAETNKDCFVDMKGFKKGFVVVNGFNIGRYWNIGPQRTLYIPAPLLIKNFSPDMWAVNEIIVVEQEGYNSPSLVLTDKHILG